MSLLTTERALYEDIWTAADHYGDHAPGEQYVPMFLDCVPLAVSQYHGCDRHTLTWTPSDYTVLDAGCGTGKGGVALQQQAFHVKLCDLTDHGLTLEARALPFTAACLWQDLSAVYRGFGPFQRTKFDFTYCCDVLEHIPPQFTMLAIDQLLRVSRYGLFLSVSLVSDYFGVWAGRPLHQTVQSFTWWRDSLAELGTVLDARDLHHNAVFFVRAR